MQRMREGEGKEQKNVCGESRLRNTYFGKSVTALLVYEAKVDINKYIFIYFFILFFLSVWLVIVS